MSPPGRPKGEYRSARREGSPVTLSTAARIEAAVAALGTGPLTESALQAHVAPLFSRALEAGAGRVYLANHSLGRPLDATADDVREGLDAWYTHLGAAWGPWMDEIAAFRARLAALVHAPRADCVIPKTSAGQGLRAILNTFDRVPRVVATRGEFDSLDVILREYARRGRIELAFVEPDGEGTFTAEDIVATVGARVDLVVISDVIFNTGQRLPRLRDIVAATHAAGGRVLLDVYHSLGVFAVDVASLDVDFAVGGSYKYLRGGPGACFLYIAPRHLDGSLAHARHRLVRQARHLCVRAPRSSATGRGGDAFLESTPPVLPAYQARAGQLLLAALGVARVRAWSLSQQRNLLALLASTGVKAKGGTEDRGAFVTVVAPQARAWCDALAGTQRGDRRARPLSCGCAPTSSPRSAISRRQRRPSRPSLPEDGPSQAPAAPDHEAHEEHQAHHEDRGSHDPHHDHLLRADRNRIALHRLALADSEEARQDDRDHLEPGRVARWGRRVGGRSGADMGRGSGEKAFRS